MKPLIMMASIAAVAAPMAMATPAAAQNRNYNREVRQCNRELQRADSRAEYRRDLRQCRRQLAKAQRRDARDWRQYDRYDYNRYETGYNQYYADRYYRDGSYYPDRRMTRNDRIYRGQNGNYYCRRNDGTTGLIVGGAVGALIGRELDRGGSRTVGTIIGAGAGALLGREIARGGLRCN